MAKDNPEIADHKAWLGYVQPEGLVVTAQALADAGVQIDKGLLPELQERFKELLTTIPLEGTEDDTAAGIANLTLFCEEFFGWPARFIVGDPRPEPIPDDLTVALPDFEETLSPTIALRWFEPKADASPWVLLIQKVPNGRDLDKNHAAHPRAWDASPSKKFERLLRDSQVHVGLLTNGTHFRLVYAPAKENSGHLTFPVQAMTEVGGRLILGAFHTLLRAQTVLNAPDRQHLHRLLAVSREYQATVSTLLAEQVLFALYELLRGFQAAHDIKGGVLDHPLRHNPNQIYEGLLTVLLRLVFLLFAEDRGLMPGGRTYSRHYSVHGLFEKLRADHEKYADQMDGRYGAWPRLLALFRIVHNGCRHGELTMPARHGHLFDPDRFPFLEGRLPDSLHVPDNLPLVSDGTLCRVLRYLMVLNGERISYRTLDVEEIGSVYQTIMGFGILVSPGTAVALRGKRKKGGVPAAPIIVIEELLAQAAKDRTKWLKEGADHEFSGEAEKQLKAAATVDDVLAVLGPKIDRNATPSAIPKGKLALQPTDERRRSGSHYTPRSFTEPIVRKTLEPVLKRFGPNPTPEQILSLKIADIAVGSAAFLVEVCRQLADALVVAWRHHRNRPAVPPDETEELLAMRVIAQRCVYGVDRNAMAVDLAKLSLWLATLAKDHPFTFLDHSIRCGDALVGLTRKQIECFHWDDSSKEAKQTLLFAKDVTQRTNAALKEREALIALTDDFTSPQLKRQKLEVADERLQLVRDIGDAAIAAFFSSEKPKDREGKRTDLAEGFVDWLQKGDIRKRPAAEINALKSGEFPVIPFHWEIEFPEVFARQNPGFDAIVGNPPFAGKNTLINGNREGYVDWLKSLHVESHGNADLVAHFFRRAFNVIRNGGTFGLIATNTIGQGDTRASGLRWICLHGGVIYAARKRTKWPGQAAVVVSVVWVIRGNSDGPLDLDGREVPVITAYLFHAGRHENPAALLANAGKSFNGVKIYGQGFTFDDTDIDSVANSLQVMHELVANDPRNGERILPYIGGEEVNDSPTQAHHRYVISFNDFPLRREDSVGSWLKATEQERDSWLRTGVVPRDYPGPVAADWPALLRVVERRVKPEREKLGNADGGRLAGKWWQFARSRPELRAAMATRSRVLVISEITAHFCFAFLPTHAVLSHRLKPFGISTFDCFGLLQSRVHEIWARFFSSTLEDRLNYSPSDCFETFPFPFGFETNAALEAAGREYYEFRAALMQDLWLGLTEIYNLFHAPDDEALTRLEALYRKRAASSEWRAVEKVPSDRSPLTAYRSPPTALGGVRRLRELHAAMDDAVLRAYGWDDLAATATCEFLLDYEDDDDDDRSPPTAGCSPLAARRSPSPRRRKLPWRYRWPDEFRDEVLARLLKLNAQRAEEERLKGMSKGGGSPPPPPKPRRGRRPPDATGPVQPAEPDLFG